MCSVVLEYSLKVLNLTWKESLQLLEKNIAMGSTVGGLKVLPVSLKKTMSSQ